MIYPPSLNDLTFNKIRDIFYEITGIYLDSTKKPLVQNRLIRVLQRNQINNFETYCEKIKHPENKKLILEFVDQLTTTTTSFFRIPYHFDYIREQLDNYIISTINTEGLFHILCAGCSSGQEPYSLVMTFLQKYKGPIFEKIMIDAIDINETVINKAKAGKFSKSSFDQLKSNEKKFFDFDGKQAIIKDIIKRRVSFKRANILNNKMEKSHYNIIFCRNTLIYFSKEMQYRMSENLRYQLKDEGYLFCGPSENLELISDKFKIIDPKGIYMKA